MIIGCLGPPRAAHDSDAVGIGYLGIITVATLAGARIRAARRPRRPSVLRVLPGSSVSPADQDRPLCPVR
jgi:hypothetical protein